MNIYRIAPAFGVRTPVRLEASEPGFGRKLVIDASDGVAAVLTSSFGLAPGQPLPAEIAAAQGGRGPRSAVPCRPGPGAGRRAGPAGQPSARQCEGAVLAAPAPRIRIPRRPRRRIPPARKGLAERARLFAESRDAVAEARARLPEIAREEADLRAGLDALAAERRAVEESSADLHAAAEEHGRALEEALRLTRQGA